MRRNVRANSPWCGSRRGAVCWRGVPPRRPAHLFVGLGCEAGALDAQRDDVLLAQLHLRRVQASRSGRALALRQGKAGEGRARLGEGGKAAEGAARRRLGERVDHVFLDAILDALRGHDHACRNQTGWLAPVATQSNAAWRARQWAKLRRRETGRTSPLLCSLRHLRAAAPPPDAHWRVAACSAGTCTCAVRGRSASDRRC